MVTKQLTKTLNNLLTEGGSYVHNDKVIKFTGWKLTGNDITFTYTDTVTEQRYTHPVSFDILQDFLNNLTPVVESAEIPQNLHDLRKFLLLNIGKLQCGLMDIDQAREIANQVQTVVNITKLELQYYRELKMDRTVKKLGFIESNKI